MSKKLKIFLIILIFLITILLVYLYAMFIGTSGFYVKEYKVESQSLNIDYNGLKIAHLSDIHYGNRSISKQDLIDIVNDVNKLKPDIIVITGDLIDDYINDKQYNELVEVLTRLNANLGKYIINGNHDYDYSKWSQLVDDINFKNLNDTYDILYNNSYSSIIVTGISSNMIPNKKITDKTTGIFNYLKSEENNSTYNILLMHEPDYIENFDYTKFDLVLAGHSHDGQVKLPFIGPILLPKGSKKYYSAHYEMNDTELYISSGIGTSILPIRLFNRPSYNFYRIIKK